MNGPPARVPPNPRSSQVMTRNSGASAESCGSNIV